VALVRGSLVAAIHCPVGIRDGHGLFVPN
jgi:hypothetical protein